MPLYRTECLSCHFQGDIFRTIAERDSLPTCDCGGVRHRILTPPAIQTDIAPYQSPGTNKWIHSRAQQREDLKQSGAILYEPGLKEQIAQNSEYQKEKSFAPISAAVDNIVKNLVNSQKLEN